MLQKLIPNPPKKGLDSKTASAAAAHSSAQWPAIHGFRTGICDGNCGFANSQVRSVGHRQKLYLDKLLLSPPPGETGGAEEQTNHLAGEFGGPERINLDPKECKGRSRIPRIWRFLGGSSSDL